ncbi:tyrosine-type recombinase/integrase [Polaribacter atrinae]|uniref:Integrase n=1 Tax=Polaribacter atrinae TaxID=1333662 RepID=A0A176TDL6_9FLAO|nr:site-specific integrase [Polaribacter atrinae]OAD46007.1 integrase [Polaribacter atrinae]
MAVKVKLREKNISGGRKSLYLDFYPAITNHKTGKKTRREFLGLYLYLDKKELKSDLQKLEERIKNLKLQGKDTTSQEKELLDTETFLKTFKGLSSTDKMHNSNTLRRAESIRQKRDNIIGKPEIYSNVEKEQLRINELGEQCFIEYLKKLANKKYGSTHSSWISALKFFEAFTKGSVKFKDLTPNLLEDFKSYLLKANSNKSSKVKLKINTASSYFNKIKAALKQAYKDEILQTDLNNKISPIAEEETRRDFLTIEEVNILYKTSCKNILLRQAAIFSALTGMAFKEIQNMVWDDITFSQNTGYTILTKRQKTKSDNYLPISEQAFSLLGKRKEPTEKVFKGLKYSAYNNKHLAEWISSAGISKKITFHCFRHTYATLQLSNGTDMYTLSKMLGHKSIKTTEIYAKIIDKVKRDTTDKIKLDL